MAENKKFRFAVASLVHDHAWGLIPEFNNHPEVEIVAAADPNKELRDRFLERFPQGKVYEDYHEMLDKEQIDICLVTSENSRTAEISEVVAAHKVNICIEKPISANLEQADRIIKAAKDNDVMVFVNWATNWAPKYRTLFRLLREGAIGRIIDLRARMAHHGPMELGCDKYFWHWLYKPELNGAGAYMDYCCYGACMMRLFLGMPKEVMGWRNTLVKDYLPADSDDNGMVIAMYDNAIARSEGGWCDIPDYHDCVFIGEKGKLVTCKDKLLISTKPGTPFEEVKLDEVPVEFSNCANNMIYCLKNHVAPDNMCDPIVSRDAQEILEAGLISDREGKRIQLPLK